MSSQPSVRRVMCPCGQLKTVRATDTAYALTWAGWEYVAGAWQCPLCAWEARRNTIVTVGR